MNTRLTPSVAVKLPKTPTIRVFFRVFSLFFTLFFLFFTGFSPTLLFGSEKEEEEEGEKEKVTPVTAYCSTGVPTVKWGLQWLVRHQLPDGSWSFNHSVADPTQCTCENPGEYTDCITGATALALLPFLGANLTHKGGYKDLYKDQIHAGLKFLLSSLKKAPNSPDSASLYQDQGKMYAHGLGTLCLTELYAMTKDRTILFPAQAAANYIMYSQNPTDGGWRFDAPREPGGNTITTGLQLISLQSAYNGYLRVNPSCIQKGMNFLDSVQLDGGATYGYAKPGKDPTCTAIGLLCRMHYGWDRNNPALVKGIEYLSDLGPNSDIFYNYYATQLLRHYGGEHWKKWHEKMRRQLITTQIKEEGHAKGS
ncbi:MAG: terpene cyclase/mutase family protein [Planctomycetia bacterium]|nr:terpene cyclase/mutase family protein [Planctomycetia bacterium]